MRYQVSRSGQIYGPYMVEDLRRYVASGNILPGDMAKPEGVDEWQSVAQILGVQSEGVVPPVYGSPTDGYAGTAGIYPDPPNLNWVLLLVLGLVTFGLFSIAYEIVQVVWVKKVQPQTKALLYYMLFLFCWALNFAGTFSNMVLLAHGASLHRPLAVQLFSALTSLGILVFVIAYRFAMRNSLEQHFNTADPAGLRLGPVMTLLFGGLYFQYHFNQINRMKQALRYRGMGV